MKRTKRHTKEAFRWVISILRKHKIPFEIFGGLAAKLYGSRRELADIDIDIPEKKFPIILSEVRNYINFGPAKYKDKNWNLLLMTLTYKGQMIDICGYEHTKIFDHSTKRWVQLENNFSKHTLKYIYGMRVPVATRKELVIYKKKIWRRVDKADVLQIEKVN